jgi:C4-dicarboxylate transporter DctQ subunit
MGENAPGEKGDNGMKVLSRFIEKITDLTGYLCAWVTFAMMLLILYEALMRYGFRHSPMLADELSSYMLVFLAFVGLAYTWKSKGHVIIDVVTIHLPRPVVHRLRVITLVVALACSIMLTKLGYDFIVRTANMRIYSDSWLRVPQVWPRGLIFVGFLILSIQLIAELIKIKQSPEKK